MTVQVKGHEKSVKLASLLQVWSLGFNVPDLRGRKSKLFTVGGVLSTSPEPMKIGDMPRAANGIGPSGADQ